MKSNYVQNPLKLIELNDFLRFPWILSENIHYEKHLSKFHFDQTLTIETDSSKRFELVLPKNVILFADEIDRKKMFLYRKSSNIFSRHLLINKTDAIESFLSSLIDAEQWILFLKIKSNKTNYQKQIEEVNVLLFLNIQHPLIRYEILNSFNHFRHSFDETKSSSIMFDFSPLLTKWFKFYLRENESYRSLKDRIFHRYQIQPLKYSMTWTRRNIDSTNYSFKISDRFRHLLKVKFHKLDRFMKIFVDFNSLPTLIYSIHFENLFIYSINNQDIEVIRDIGYGLSLISVFNLHEINQQIYKKDNNERILSLTFDEITNESRNKISFENQIDKNDQSIRSNSNLFSLNDEENNLFHRIVTNQIQMEKRHHHLMNRATKLITLSPRKFPIETKNSTDF